MEQENFDIRNQQPLSSRERDFENVLRPLAFEDFSGQDKVVDNLRVFASHGHLLPDVPPMPARFPRGTVFLRGHSHIPRGETLGDFHFWNPGSLSLPKGGSPRSYGVYEDGCFRVLDMDGREVLRHWPRQND